MAKLRKFVVGAEYKIGFDHSFSSYTSIARALVELEPGDDEVLERMAAQKECRQLVRTEADAFKLKNDLPRDKSIAKASSR